MLKKAAKFAIGAIESVRPSLVFEVLRQQYGRMIPFAKYCHIQQLELGSGTATSALPSRPELKNHIGSQHAAALFLLGESCSGGAVIGAFPKDVLDIRPVAAGASIKYLKVAKGVITARATTSEPAETLRTKLKRDGKVVFSVDVSMVDEADVEVATMNVDWHVSPKRS